MPLKRLSDDLSEELTIANPHAGHTPVITTV
jgi:hypothetical protein